MHRRSFIAAVPTLPTGGSDDLGKQLDEETRIWETLIRDANITAS